MEEEYNNTQTQDNTQTQGGNDIMEKLTALSAKIEKLELEKTEFEKNINPDDPQRVQDIKKTEVIDKDLELQGAHFDMDKIKNEIMEATKKDIEFSTLMSNVINSKQEQLKEILDGKTIEQKIAYINKYKAEYFLGGSEYQNASGDNNKSPDTELDVMMNQPYIKEAQLTREEVKQFLNEGDVMKFEQQVLRDYKMIKNPKTLRNFFGVK